VSERRPVRLRELTLRQLGHMETDLHFEEKLYWLAALDRAGVQETVVWGVDDDAVALAEAARARGLGVELSFFGKVYFPHEMREILDRVAAAGASHAALVGRGADFSLDEMGWSPEQMLEACVVATQEAKARGVRVSIGLAYSTQADPDYVCEVAQAVEQAGCDLFHIPDSLGVASPEQLRALVERVRAVVSIPIEVHCHNDYGLATANAIACAQGGADIVEVIVNGQDPERSGIASLDEVAVALELLYDFDTGIDLAQLTELSRLHERMTGARIADNKPIVGRRAFNYRVAPGVHASAPKRDHFYGSPRVVPFDPALVGNERVFMLGKFSGANEVTKGLADLGLELDEQLVPDVVRLVNDRGRSEKRSISETELRYFAEVVAASAAGRAVAS
jgi:isopropylmalate/homocitrate/citramalate synthase